MSKFNLGLAYYGRGYTLLNGTCNYEGCTTTANAVPAAACSGEGSDGVWLNSDIMSFISKNGITPGMAHMSTGAFKTILWDANGEHYWMGYDDGDSLKVKRNWASGRCFGGTFIWEVDFWNVGKQ